MDLKPAIRDYVLAAARPVSVQEVTIDQWYPLRMQVKGGPPAVEPAALNALTELASEGIIEMVEVDGEPCFQSPEPRDSAPSRPAARAARTSRLQRATTMMSLVK